MAGPELIAAALIALATLVAIVRLAIVRRDSRAALLVALMLASAALLYLTLSPPRLPVGGETLVVATAEAPATIAAGAGERVVSLPEAPAVVGAERVPDLATAVRRYRQVQRIRIVGRGLTARDRDSDVGVPVAFRPIAVPPGLIRLDPPADVPAGSVFILSGAARGLNGGSAELLDPAGRRVDQRRIGEDGAFSMGGTARTAGLALFTVRLRDARKAIVSDTQLPVRASTTRPTRVLLVGAPSPETKYLRRWATDSGLDLTSQLDVGGAVRLGDAPVSLSAATLGRADALIIDDRSWNALGQGTRASVAQAVRNGLGIVVRMTGPATPELRRSLRTIGLAIEGGAETQPVALPPLAADGDMLEARRGPGEADAPDDLNALDDPVPQLMRFSVTGGRDLVPAISDDAGSVLAGWEQLGQGRAALWTVADSFALVLNGQAQRYYQWWSETLSAVARPDRRFRPDLPALARVGDRVPICGLEGRPRVVDPAGETVPVAIDPRSGQRGCAAYWPKRPGVHEVVQPTAAGARSFAFYIQPAAALAPLRALETAEATRVWAERQQRKTMSTPPDRDGPAWPWFLGWLVVSAALWIAERRWRRPGVQRA
ncbi:carboxypeptidase regulatory-like domain-containing protein [Sphingomonas sp. ST-64]|uniref:Carboxypeptidase regulatory-like domain-containing protein n=1 Tax=Sphingomonas plantiphila TaxID=3163295 RepID=A0ABW8YN52_9SPHN